MASTPPLPKRFLPLLAQVQNEAALRYGSQESGIASILGQLSRQRDNDLGAQQTANMSLLGSLQGADKRLAGFSSEAGLTPEVQASLVGTPTGARLAGELVQNRADNQQALLGAQAGNQYQVGHINDQYNDQVQTLSDQLQAEQKERGIFTQGQLDTLISGDRSARHDANVAAAKQTHDDLQSELTRQTQIGNALIGQGLQPVLGSDGSVTIGAPLPGGRADPNAPGNTKKPKRTTGPGTATGAAQLKAGTQFSTAFGTARKGLQGKGTDPDAIRTAVDSLVSGRKAAKGATIYDQVPDTNQYGQVKKNPDGSPKMKQVPRIQPAKNPDGSPNPLAGQRVTAPPTPASAPVPRPIAQAAAEQAAYGYVTTATVRALQKLGYSVNQIPGLTTQNQHATSTPASPTTQRTNPNKSGSIRDIFG